MDKSKKEQEVLSKTPKLDDFFKKKECVIQKSESINKDSTNLDHEEQEECYYTEVPEGEFESWEVDEPLGAASGDVPSHEREKCSEIIEEACEFREGVAADSLGSAYSEAPSQDVVVKREVMLEVCVDSLEGARAARAGGARALEVCAALALGGLTPSTGLLAMIMEEMPELEVSAMVRCRGGGDFCYSETELRVMEAEARGLAAAGARSLVFGALDAARRVHAPACARLLAAAPAARFTFHRAFDRARDPLAALEDIIRLGFARILTSGQKPSVDHPEALDLVRRLILQAGGRIQIMPGGGITERNVAAVASVGADVYHASCKVEVSADPEDCDINFGTVENEKRHTTDETTVANIVNSLNAPCDDKPLTNRYYEWSFQVLRVTE